MKATRVGDLPKGSMKLGTSASGPCSVGPQARSLDSSQKRQWGWLPVGSQDLPKGSMQLGTSASGLCSVGLRPVIM